MSTATEAPPSTLRLTPRMVAWTQATCIGVVIGGYFLAVVMRHFLGIEKTSLWSTLDVGVESSLPTWYSSMALLLAALQALGIAWSEAGRRRCWLFLGLALLLLSVDEVATLHERFGTAMADRLLGVTGERSPMRYFSWIAVGAPVAFAALVCGWGFFRSLPTRTKRLFGVALAVYLAGALAVEAANGAWRLGHGTDAIYAIGTGVEELLEMVGVAILLYELVSYRPLWLAVGPAPLDDRGVLV